jgi:CRP-like cAMP-binding protein
MDQKLQVLAGVPLFAGLPAKELEQISRICDQVSLKAGHVVAREGTGGSEFFVILDGTVAVTKEGEHLRDMGRGEFFGELSLLGHVPRTATVTCTTDGEFLVLGRREFSQLLADYPSIQGAVLQALATRLATLAPDHTH